MAEPVGSVVRTSRRIYWQVDSHWLSVLVGGSTLLVGVATVAMFSLRPWYVNRDSALFQHGGWWLLNGAELYVDIWDLKPPLIYAVASLLAFLSGGDMAVLHVLSIGLTVATVVAGVTLVGVLVHRLTDDGVASVVGGSTMFVLTAVYGFPFAGLRPKYFAFLLGVGALLLVIDGRPFLAGVAGGVAAGFWQLAAPLALLVVGMALQRHGWLAMWRTIAGGLTVAVLTVLPFVLQGNAVPLVVETVIAPIYGVEEFSVGARLLMFGLEFGYATLVVPLAVTGWMLGLRDSYREYWWVVVGSLLYMLQLFLEFQGAIELVLLVVFLAVGVGLLVSYTSTPARKSAVAGCIVLLIVLSAYWSLGLVTTVSPVPPGQPAVEAAYEEAKVREYDSLPPDPDWPSMQTIYWEQRTPEHCHYRLGVKQQYFAQETGGSLYKTTCGQWPYAEPPVEWVLSRLSPL